MPVVPHRPQRTLMPVTSSVQVALVSPIGSVHGGGDSGGGDAGGGDGGGGNGGGVGGIM